MLRTKRGKAVIVLVVVLVGLGALIYLTTAPPANPLQDISSEAELKALFNQDAGKKRIILLLSPT